MFKIFFSRKKLWKNCDECKASGFVETRFKGIYGIYYNGELIFISHSDDINYSFKLHQDLLINNIHYHKNFQNWFIDEKISIYNLEVKMIKAVKYPDEDIFVKLLNKYSINSNPLFRNKSFIINNIDEYNVRNIIYFLYTVEFYSIESIINDFQLDSKNINTYKINERLNIYHWEEYTDEQNIEKLKYLISNFKSWKERSIESKIDANVLKSKAKKYGVIELSHRRNYNDVINDFGSEFIVNIINDHHINGDKTCDWICSQLNCTPKTLQTLKKKLM